MATGNISCIQHNKLQLDSILCHIYLKIFRDCSAVGIHHFQGELTLTRRDLFLYRQYAKVVTYIFAFLDNVNKMLNNNVLEEEDRKTLLPQMLCLESAAGVKT